MMYAPWRKGMEQNTGPPWLTILRSNYNSSKTRKMDTYKKLQKEVWFQDLISFWKLK